MHWQQRLSINLHSSHRRCLNCRTDQAVNGHLARMLIYPEARRNDVYRSPHTLAGCMRVALD